MPTTEERINALEAVNSKSKTAVELDDIENYDVDAYHLIYDPSVGKIVKMKGSVMPLGSNKPYATVASLPVEGGDFIAFVHSDPSAITPTTGNGYYVWESSAWTKKAGTVEDFIDPANTTKGVSGNAVTNFVESKALTTTVSNNTIERVSSAINAISQFNTSVGFTYQLLDIDTISPVLGITNMLRASYNAGADARIDISLTPVEMHNDTSHFYFYVKKADIFNVPNEIKFFAFTKAESTIEDIVDLGYFDPTELINGYVSSLKVGSSTLTVRVLQDTLEWLLIDYEIHTSSNTASHFVVRFYVNGLNWSNGNKLDIVNMTAYSEQESFNFSLPSIGLNQVFEYKSQDNIERIEGVMQSKNDKVAINYIPKKITDFISTDFVLNKIKEELSSSVYDEKLNSFLRVSYGITSATAPFFSFAGTNGIPLNNKKGLFFGSIRKSDLINLPNQIKFFVYTRTTTTNNDVVDLGYVHPTVLVEGYNISKTTGSTTVNFRITSDNGVFVSFRLDLTTTSETQNNFIPRIYINNVVQSSTVGNIDFINATATDGGRNYNESLISLGGFNDNDFHDPEVVSIDNTDKIVFVGDSYTESDYTLKDKAYISNVSQRLDYNVYSVAKAGDDLIEHILRIEANEPRYTDTFGIKDLGAKYAFIALYANDSVYRDWSLDMFKENYRNMIQKLRDLGIEPILSTEFFLYNFFANNPGYNDSAIIRDLADEMGCDFVDVAQTSMNFIKAKESDFWYGSHPATRTNSVMWKVISEKLKSLPRPNKSIKIFRNRGIESNFYTDTLYKNDVEKNALYQEISVGHYYLSDHNEIYFDRQSELTATIAQEQEDEYLKLRNKEAISFSRHALIEAIVPYNANSIDKLRLTIATNDTIYPFVRKKKTPFPSTKGTAFKYTGAPTLVIGDTYLISNCNDTYFNGKTITVSRIIDGYIIDDNESYAYRGTNTNGDLTRQTGTGDLNVSFNTVKGSFVADYYTNYAKRYEWESLMANEFGTYDIDNSNRAYVEGDKIVIIVRNLAGFSISDVKLELPKKDISKIKYSKKFIEPITNGNSLISQRMLGTAPQLADWTTTGTVNIVQPIGSANPRWSSGAVLITSTNSISQAITFTNGRANQSIQIQVWANHEPAKFVGTDMATSPITKTSYDCSIIKIEIYSNGVPGVVFEREVGLGYQEILINTHLAPDMVNPRIKISSKDKDTLIAYVDVLARAV